MEHIIQFAIGIDDERIAQSVEKSAEKTIVKDIEAQVANKLFENRYYGRDADPARDNLSEFSRLIVSDMLHENKDAIVDKAAQYLAEKIARSKAGEEVIEKAKLED